MGTTEINDFYCRHLHNCCSLHTFQTNKIARFSEKEINLSSHFIYEAGDLYILARGAIMHGCHDLRPAIFF